MRSPRKPRRAKRGILAVRMVPQQVFDKLSRVVRRMSREAIGKDIHFVVSGGDTKLDKLDHRAVRSADAPDSQRDRSRHRISSFRLARGKPAAGTVAINAEQRGNHVVLEIEDDGNGIDTQALVQRAVARADRSAKQARDMTRAEIYELMFLPGLSTRAVADETSGRGVGMDVIKTNISRMAGIIEVGLGAGTWHATDDYAADYARDHSGAGDSGGGALVCDSA